MRLILLFFTFLYGSIIQFENLKPFYYTNQMVNLKVKILTNQEDNISTFLSRGKILSRALSPYVYEANLTFKAVDKPLTFYITSNSLIEDINLSQKIHLKEIEKVPGFCGVFANDLKVLNGVSSEYNKSDNIVTFNVVGKLANLEDFSLNAPTEKKSLNHNELAYYVIVPKNMKRLKFFYFNLREDRFVPVEVPIILKEEKVVTQSDISPKENYFSPLNIALMGLSLFLLFSAFLFRSVILTILAILLILFTFRDFIPKGEMFLQKGSKIYLLPTQNSTVIEITNSQKKVKVLKKVNGYSKVIIDNKVGWVKNEN